MTTEPELDVATVSVTAADVPAEDVAAAHTVSAAAAESHDDESQLAGALGKLALASIGALSYAEETAEKVLRRLVDRGETDLQSARRTLGKLRPRRPRLPRPPRPVLTLGGGGLASKQDVQALQQRLDALSAQIDALAKSTNEGG